MSREVDEQDEQEDDDSPIYASYHMPFGKYKGYFLRDLADDYLCWLHRQGLDGKLGVFVGMEIKHRGLLQDTGMVLKMELSAEGTAELTTKVMKVATSIIRSGYYAQAKEKEPTDEMNAARELLDTLVELVGEKLQERRGESE